MRKSSRAALILLMAMGATGIALAGTPSATGLGQAWPDATDVSANPHWHVYVFELNGIKYVQVNDLNGNVLGAIGTAGGQFITLPVGQFAQNVSTPQQAALNHASSVSGSVKTVVYKDNAIAITATPQSDGGTLLDATNASALTDCQSDPEECNKHGP